MEKDLEKKDLNNEIQNEEDFIDSFKNDEAEMVDLTSEKLNEINKTLPEWSIEPPHNFLNKNKNA